MRLLNNQGFPLSRNLAKPFKIRKKDGKPADGCVGIVSTFGIRAYIPGPKTGKSRTFKRHARCRLPTSEDMMRLPKRRVEHYVRIRSQIKTIQTVGDCVRKDLLTPEMKLGLKKLSNYIFNSVSEDERRKIYQSDIQRERSIEGTIRKNGLKSLPRVKKLRNFVQLALKSL